MNKHENLFHIWYITGGYTPYLAIAAKGKETLQAAVWVLLQGRSNGMLHAIIYIMSFRCEIQHNKRSSSIRNTLNLVTLSVEKTLEFRDENKFTKSIPYRKIPGNIKK